MRSIRDDELAVSVLVSAVLVLGLLVVVAGTYTGTILPARVEEREAKHLQEVDATFSRIANVLASDPTRPVKFNTELVLGTELESIFVTTGSTAHLFVHQAGFYQRIECTNPEILTLGQAPAPGAKFARGSQSRNDVAWLEFIRIDLDNYRFKTGPTAAERTDTITLVAEKNREVVARFQVTLDGAERSVQIVVEDGERHQSTNQLVASGLASPLPAYLIDPMDPIHGFSGLIAGLGAPWELKFSSSTPSAGVFALYRTPSGTPGRIGTGAFPGGTWSETVRSDALVFDAAPTRFVQQTYALEGGAFVLDQPQGAVLRSGSIAALSGINKWISLSALEIDGHGSRTGAHAVQLEFNREPLGRKIVLCDNPKWNATTPYPDAWQDAWKRLGANSPNPSGQSVTATLQGRWLLEWNEARLQLDFRP